MVQPVILSSSPSNGDENVYLNALLRATFSGELVSSSVTNQSVVLTDTSSNRFVYGQLTYTSGTKEVIFYPENYLSPDTRYRFSFLGTGDAINGTILATGSSGDLLQSLNIIFRTGRDLYVQSSGELKNTYNKSLEGDIDLPSNIGVLGSSFTISKFSPKLNSAEFDIDSTEIYIDFSKPLSTGDFSQDWFSVNVEPLVDDCYVACNIDGTITLKQDNPSYTGFNEPTFSGSVSGSRLTISLVNGQFCYNQYVEVTLSNDIESSAGDTLGNNDVTCGFSTQLYPSILTLSFLKRNASSIFTYMDLYTDLYLSSKILFYTMYGWEGSCKRYPLSDLPKSSRNFAMWSTIVDILEDIDLKKAMQAGISRQLGDFLVELNPAAIGKMGILLARAQKDKELSLATLKKNSNVALFTVNSRIFDLAPDRLWHGANGKYVNAKFKYWQPDIAASNLALERQAEVPPRWF